MRQGISLPLSILSFQSAFVNKLDIILCYNAIGFTGKRPRIGLSIPSGLFFYAENREGGVSICISFYRKGGVK